MKISDQLLVEKTLKGSHRAYKELVERYQDFVFSLCLRVLKSREEAEEAAQDAFLKVFGKLSSYKGESRFSTWLYTLVYRTALDKLKLKKRQTHSLDDEEVNIQIPISRSGESAFNIEQTDLQQLLNQAMQQLPATDASIVNLYYLQGQSVKEIATVMTMSVTNVKTRLFRTREKLKGLLLKTTNEDEIRAFLKN